MREAKTPTITCYQVVECGTMRPLSELMRDERCAFMEAACWTGAMVRTVEIPDRMQTESTTEGKADGQDE